MKSTCSTCGTTYRIDPLKVPRAGIRARCSQCESVFRVDPESAEKAAMSASAEDSGQTAAEAGSASAVAELPRSEQPAPEGMGEPAASPEPDAAGATPAEETPRPRAAEAPASASPFGLADPESRARRLARALVSDIVVYHPEKREASLRNRTLRVDFQDEIRKSWNEYVAQVGEPMARGTPYFREALNEILAGGERVF